MSLHELLTGHVGVVLIDLIGGLLIVGYFVVAIVLLLRTGDISQARLLVAEGAVLGLSFKTAGSLLKTLQLHTWEQILVFTANHHQSSEASLAIIRRNSDKVNPPTVAIETGHSRPPAHHFQCSRGILRSYRDVVKRDIFVHKAVSSFSNSQTSKIRAKSFVNSQECTFINPHVPTNSGKILKRKSLS